MKFSQKLKELRNEQDLTQQELANLSDVSIYSIKRYETDKFKPKDEQILKLAEALKVSPLLFIDNDILKRYTNLHKKYKK